MVQQYFKTNYYIKFALSGNNDEMFWQIRERERIKYDTSIDSYFTSLAAGVTGSETQITNLEPAENELYYLIPSIADGAQYRFLVPAGISRNGVAKKPSIGWLTYKDSPNFAPNPSWAFYVAIKTIFSIIPKNVTPAAITPVVYFTGMKYRIQQITADKNKDLFEALVNGHEHFTEIQIGGFNR